MNYEILYTITAVSDLNNTIDYIDHILLDSSAADRLLDMLDTELAHLKDFPKIHEIIDDPFFKAHGIRYVVVKNYLAFYTVDEDKHIVYIIRFLYARRDWINVLKDTVFQR